MMARTKRDRRSYSAGEWGRNRVRVFPDPKTGLHHIEWRENGPAEPVAEPYTVAAGVHALRTNPGVELR